VFSITETPDEWALFTASLKMYTWFTRRVVTSQTCHRRVVFIPRKVSFNVEPTRSGMGIHKREQAMEDWTSVTAKIDVLVLNLSVFQCRAQLPHAVLGRDRSRFRVECFHSFRRTHKTSDASISPAGWSC
jgi:hypothetical protein